MINIAITIDAAKMLKVAKELPEALQRRILRRALEAGAQPMVQALRRSVRAHKTKDSTGILGNAIGVVVRTDRNTGRTSVRVGAIRKPKTQVILKQRRAGKRYFVIRKASRYFHLADIGRDGKRRVITTFNATRGAAGALIAEKVSELVDREVARNALL